MLASPAPDLCFSFPPCAWVIYQWDREVLKVKKKDAQCIGAKIAARMPPASSQKPRRGGWCECCEIQYIGTMSEVSGRGGDCGHKESRVHQQR